ncbi:MAG: hypothetical protein HRU03_07045 [Nanoarchaeales archaeon]|nr:hypothetical protein [Nanoarchaeales archaeon]
MSNLENIEYVVKHSKHVKINKNRLEEFSKKFKSQKVSHYLDIENITNLNLNQVGLLLLIYTSLSFSFWQKPKWSITYKNEKYTGSYALIFSFLKQLKKNKDFFEIDNLNKITKKQFKKIFSGENEIPLFEQRYNNFKEIILTIKNNYNNNFENILINSNYDAKNIINEIIKTMPNFEDTSTYKNKKITFNKRIQLFINDLNMYLKLTNQKQITNLNYLFDLADYKIPMVLRTLKILEYDSKLENKIDNEIEIKQDSEEEIEIRASQIYVNQLLSKLINIDELKLNYQLWLLGKQKKYKLNPYHKTITTKY